MTQNMRAKLIPIIMLLAAVFFLSGCQTTIVVHDAKTSKVIPIFKDYAKSRSYVFTYENDKSGAYGLDLGSVYQPFQSTTSKTSTYTTYNGGAGQPTSAYEDTTWNTVAYGGRYVEALANVRISQQDGDVMIYMDTNDAAGTELNDFVDYLKQYGYNVESK